MSELHSEFPQPLVSCDWLKTHLNDDDVRVVDASWHLPAAGRDARSEYDDAHIPGAVFFDIDEHSADSHLPHMLPDATRFANAAGALGIAADHRIIVYDSVGLFSAARVWWMFRHFGAACVSVLDGGLPAWKRSGGVLSSGVDHRAQSVAADNGESAAAFRVSSDLQHLYVTVDAADVLHSVDDEDTVVLDARSHSRFSGAEKEARPGLRSGHIPGSINLPFVTVLDEHGLLKSADELRALFDELPLQAETNIITSCGSGVTAAVLCLALEIAGYGHAALYDGSWTEWGARDELPVVTGS